MKKYAEDENYLDDADYDNEAIEDLHEVSPIPKGYQPNWRKIELVKEQLALREALSDFNDYVID